MNWMIRHGGLWLLLFFCWLPSAAAQSQRDRISQIIITNLGPPVASEQFIRGNLRTKVGDVYDVRTLDEDLKNLANTGLFTFQITISTNQTDEGVVVTFFVPGKPRISHISFEGNTNYSDAKLRKKIKSKEGDPLDDLKLFNDCQEIEKLYEKDGYTHTTVRYEMVNVDQATRRAAVLFQIKETARLKITTIEFTGAHAFTPHKLRGVLKTKQHWMFSWITGSDRFKEDQFSEDQDALREFYQKAGYIDFEIKDVHISHPTPATMKLDIVVNEGSTYRVGSVKFDGVTLMPTNIATRGSPPRPAPKDRHSPEYAEWVRQRVLDAGFAMKTGDIFKPQLLKQDLQAIEDYYGSKGHIEVRQHSENLNVLEVPNTESGTMDLQFHVNEGQQALIEKIEIRGNIKTKDNVIRRELTVAPGEVFDMVRIRASQQRIEQLGYFTRDSVRTQPETDNALGPERKNLVISVEEQSTGNMTFGAGYNTVESVFVFFTVEQRNFDLFNPPYFTGGGQKLRLNLTLGTQLQDYELTFQEPWFLGHKLILDVSLYRKVYDFQSLNNLYNEGLTGMNVGLTRALGSDRFIGSVGYNLEQVDIFNVSTNAPDTILADAGRALLNRFRASLAYDTTESVTLPDHGQRSRIQEVFTVGDRSYLKSDISTAWYFRGLGKGHVLEVVGRAGVAQPVGTEDVPFYDRYYLGGLRDLRGFDYRAVGPREVTQDGAEYEPIGGDTFWMGSAEYSIPVFVDNVRFAVFYDIGNVSAKPWNNSTFTVNGKFNEGLGAGPVPGFSQFDAGNTGVFSDNFGFGIHLQIPSLGPLRLDYGIPIHHDPFTSSNGKFQFGVGFTRPL